MRYIEEVSDVSDCYFKFFYFQTKLNEETYYTAQMSYSFLIGGVLSAREMKKIRAENLKCYLDFILFTQLYCYYYYLVLLLLDCCCFN